MKTFQRQWGARSAGVRGGRWIGRIFMFGWVAAAVASKVGSSMSWHMSFTRFSPKGSTSSNAPQ